MKNNPNVLEESPVKTPGRSGSQPIMPVRINTGETTNAYDIYPYHSLGHGCINNGYESLAGWIMTHKAIVIDGYVGVYWEEVQQYLHDEFEKQGLRVNWIRAAAYLKEPSQVQQLVEPFIGTENGVWGTRCTLQLADLFNIPAIKLDNQYELTVIIGTGASVLYQSAPVVYLDLPKNELQLRMRSSSVTNLGADTTYSPVEMYKRFYFVDWVLLNEHKKKILDRMVVIGDAQWPDTVNWSLAADVLVGLKQLGNTVFRVRPWFEPGAWGGYWMKDRIPGLSQEEINYAWSFELIVPENGIVFESDGFLLELSFDFLMFSERTAVLGKHADRFKDEFPIRFDFLDTWNGGNLSIQCHPSLPYIQQHFGETITQDETYYILDCQEEAQVYLGFQDNINPAEFREALETSRDEKLPIEITQFVQSHKANKHDLFLIPNGTVHSAAAGNLVLEISATPYIFTFKMYDWLRLGLDGEPRAINIEHAFNNLNFERKGAKVQEELISKQVVLQQGADWELVHVPTHAEHFYDVHRLEFDSEMVVETNGSCHVLMLVEGSKIAVISQGGQVADFNYAETFVIPAAAQQYTLVNKGKGRAKLIKAFLK
jgi:mannose-6-phosphate isomerase class I